MFITLLLTAIGLSMDAFAVSVCKGLVLKKALVSRALIIALFFGFFQALMPYLGWLLGSQFEQYIRNFDHWIAFGVLAIIGAKMIIESAAGKDDDLKAEDGLRVGELFGLAIATSIDALAVGVSFAFLGNEYNIYSAVTIIGITTFVLSFLGVFIGRLFGSKLKKGAEIIGGIILILIGLKILLEHLGIISF